MASGQAGQDAEPKKTLAEIEKERITRRVALRKFGFGAGMAALMALSVDDLARMAARKLEQHAGDNQVASAVAKEFKNAGIAFANPSTPRTGGNPCDGDANPNACCEDDNEYQRCTTYAETVQLLPSSVARDKCDAWVSLCKQNGGDADWTTMVIVP